MSLEVVEILVKTNAELAQTNRIMWDYIHTNDYPNQKNYEHLEAICWEIKQALEEKESRTINQEVWYRQLKETLANIQEVKMKRNNSPPQIDSQ